MGLIYTIHENRRAIALILLVSFVSNVATAFVFDSLGNYFANLAANYELNFVNDVEREAEKPSSTCSMRIEETPNGTNVFIQFVETSSVEAHALGSVFDASIYARYILMWQIFKSTYELLRDVSRMCAETLCIFYFVVLSQSDIFKYRKFWFSSGEVIVKR